MTAQNLRDRHVLAVEDEYHLAVNLERDLQAAGAVVLGPVPSVDLPIALIASEPSIDAAVLDINLGGEMSFPVAEALLVRGIPFVINTGYVDGDLDNRYPDIRRCDKPAPFRTLEQALISIL